MIQIFRLVLFSLVLGPALAVETVDFNRDIQPILSDTCFNCHGPDANTRKADLRLDTREGLFGKVDDESIVTPGDPAASLLFHRVNSDDPDEQMPPPKNQRQLSSTEIDLIERWIKAGAPWSGHWAFESVKRPPVPTPKAAERVRTPVDAFVLSRLESEGLSPSPEADLATLLRRLSLDLTGLPPEPERAAAFLATPAEERDFAIRTLVDDLLASPAFGERMATIWMEPSRFSESDGYQLDQVRAQYPWRDWVIKAFNRNLPYDRFVLEQTAGDLLPDASEDQIIATGFNRNHMINGEGGVDPAEFRIEMVADRAETTATTFLGLTLACARCHDHKFDPITQEDYFRFFAFFNNIDETGRSGHNAGPFLEIPVSAAHRQQAEDYQANTKHHHITFPKGNTLKVAVLKDRDGEVRKTHMLHRGEWGNPMREVTAAPPAFLPGFPDTDAPQTRLDLARWIIARENPLTARVAVNRMWELFFGRGIVTTQEDFGVQSARPSHPELLDWLAADFMDNGWDVQRLLRQIVLSSTYRQVSATDAAARERDPKNALLARASRFRHPSWMLRDQALAASGLLHPERFGPSVRPYQPANIWFTPTAGKIRYGRHDEERLYRKSLYTFWRRTTAPANMFDSSPRRVCEVNVRRTNTPLHALVLLNDVTYVESARALAARVLKPEPDNMPAAISAAFQRVLVRSPSDTEQAELTALHAESLSYYQTHPKEAAALLAFGEHPADVKDEDAATLAAMANVALLILNTDEALSHQ